MGISCFALQSICRSRLRVKRIFVWFGGWVVIGGDAKWHKLPAGVCPETNHAASTTPNQDFERETRRLSLAQFNMEYGRRRAGRSR
jgi:hypothetical protein